MSSNNDFLGREDLLLRLWQELEHRSFLLVGPRRIGKTALLKQMARVPAKGWSVVRVDVEGLGSVENAVEAITTALQHAGLLKTSLQETTNRIENVTVAGTGVSLRPKEGEREPWLRLEKHLQAVLKDMKPEQRLLLALDEVPWWLDEIRQSQGERAARGTLANLRRLRQQEGLSSKLRMILTGSMGLAGLARSLDASAELNDLQPEVEVPPLKQAAGAALFEAQVAIRKVQCPPDVAAAAHDLTGGSPHWIKALAAKAAASGHRPGHQLNHKDLDIAVEALLHPKLRDQFDDEGRSHLIRRHGRPKAARMAAILDAALDAPVPESSLVAAAMSGIDAPNPREIRELIYTLVDEFYLSVESINKQNQYTFTNPLFQRWWKRYGGEL